MTIEIYALLKPKKSAYEQPLRIQCETLLNFGSPGVGPLGLPLLVRAAAADGRLPLQRGGRHPGRTLNCLPGEHHVTFTVIALVIITTIPLLQYIVLAQCSSGTVFQVVMIIIADNDFASSGLANGRRAGSSRSEQGLNQIPLFLNIFTLAASPLLSQLFDGQPSSGLVLTLHHSSA